MVRVLSAELSEWFDRQNIDHEKWIAAYVHVDETIRSQHPDTQPVLSQGAQKSIDAALGIVDRLADLFFSRQSRAIGDASERAFVSMMRGAHKAWQIDPVGHNPHTADVLVRYDRNRAAVIVEVKNKQHGTSKDDMDKFHDDIKTTGLHGIMINISGGIATKTAFQPEPVGRQHAMYLPYNGGDVGRVSEALTVLEFVTRVYEAHDVEEVQATNEQLHDLALSMSRELDGRRQAIHHMRSALHAMEGDGLRTVYQKIQDVRNVSTRAPSRVLTCACGTIFGNQPLLHAHQVGCERFLARHAHGGMNALS